MRFSAEGKSQEGETVGRMGIAGLRPLNDAELATLAEYAREMEEVVIPQIKRDMQERSRLAHESRQMWLGR